MAIRLAFTHGSRCFGRIFAQIGNDLRFFNIQSTPFSFKKGT